MTEHDTLNLMYRVGRADRLLENLEAPDEVLDRIAKDIDAVTDDECPRIAKEGYGARDS